MMHTLVLCWLIWYGVPRLAYQREKWAGTELYRVRRYVQ